MKRVTIALFLAALFSASGLAAGQSSDAQPASTLQANSNLVVVDVVVSDSHHNPVHKLTKADFTVLEDGKPQAIKSFEEHSSTDAPAPLPPLPKLPPGMFTNYTAVAASGALNVLLLDSLNTPTLDKTRLREQVLDFLNEVKPGTRIAIFGITTQLLFLQGFTSDPAVLRAVLSSKKGAPKPSPLTDKAVSGNNLGAEDDVMDWLHDNALSLSSGQDPVAANEIMDNLLQLDSATESYEIQARARYTLDAFNQLARYLSNLPGRKNVIWFSGSFPVYVIADPDLADPFLDDASFEYELRETSALLSKSQVAVYPIDARGLTSVPMLDVNNPGNKYPPVYLPVYGPHHPASVNNAYSKDMNTFTQKTDAEHGTMQSMADATGGKPFLQTNDLKEAVEKAIADGSNYYTISYTPANQNWNGAYRKIQVELASKDATLSYRRGYFANDPNAAPKSSPAPAKAPANGPAPYNPMLAAMLRGAPEPAEITFAAIVRPASAGTENKPVQTNKLARKIAGPYRRYTVNFFVNALDLGCAAAALDGVHRCALHSEVFVYNADGAALNTQSNDITLNFTADRLAEFMRTGFRFSEEISAPVKTGAFLRIGVRDVSTNKIGAIELPISGVSNLPVAPAGAAK